MQPPFRQFHGTTSYLTDEALEAAVNCALALERPLLIKGEPGTGKTLLAHAVAEAQGAELIHWAVKSTTKAQDGLYVYDTVQRLYDARFGDGDVKDIRRYIRLGPLGQAFKADKRLVLLIDEVDKADLEFPNDLLHELDRMRFFISETGDEVVARQRPIVIITSNNEKELPDAFLRRCVFHFIDFPNEELMRKIVRVHHPALDDRLVDQAVVAFYELRSTPRLRKKPSTSELIDWLAVLARSEVGAERLKRELPLPFAGVLLKKEQDHAALAEHRSGGVRRRLVRETPVTTPRSSPLPTRGRGGLGGGVGPKPCSRQRAACCAHGLAGPPPQPPPTSGREGRASGARGSLAFATRPNRPRASRSACGAGPRSAPAAFVPWPGP